MIKYYIVIQMYTLFCTLEFIPGLSNSETYCGEIHWAIYIGILYRSVYLGLVEYQ